MAQQRLKLHYNLIYCTDALPTSFCLSPNPSVHVQSSELFINANPFLRSDFIKCSRRRGTKQKRRRSSACLTGPVCLQTARLIKAPSPSTSEGLLEDSGSLRPELCRTAAGVVSTVPRQTLPYAFTAPIMMLCNCLTSCDSSKSPTPKALPVNKCIVVQLLKT